jgi:hypothetical protein
MVKPIREIAIRRSDRKLLINFEVKTGIGVLTHCIRIMSDKGWLFKYQNREPNNRFQHRITRCAYAVAEPLCPKIFQIMELSALYEIKIRIIQTQDNGALHKNRDRKEKPYF